MIGFSVQLKSPAITCCPNNVRRVKNTGRKREKSDKKKKKAGSSLRPCKFTTGKFKFLWLIIDSLQ